MRRPAQQTWRVDLWLASIAAAAAEFLPVVAGEVQRTRKEADLDGKRTLIITADY